MTAETVEQMINEIGKIKTQMNSTELQLYEANEKIAELSENVGESGIYEERKIFVIFKWKFSNWIAAPAPERREWKSQSGKFKSH